MAAKPAPAVSVPKPAPKEIIPTPPEAVKVYQLGEGSETDVPAGAALPPTQIAEEQDEPEPEEE